MRAALLLALLLAGCAVAPLTISPLTFSNAPPAYVPGVNPHNEMRSHIRLPSCGQCHR
jgi:hypothetical protein